LSGFKIPLHHSSNPILSEMVFFPSLLIARLFHEISRMIKQFYKMLMVLAVACSAQEPDLFPVPDILKNNVAFWKKIYTEVSLREGLLHDRDYPLIIYGKIDIGDLYGRAESRYVGAQEEKIIADINDLITKPETEWTSEEKQIKSLFDTYAPGDSLKTAVDWIRFQRGQKERFIAGLERSGMYIDTIRAILKEFGIPERLAYLPHVESSFNYNAYSHVGAAGLWQFMRGTGRLFLEINYTVDERLDPVLATYAAAKLLKRNYDELQSWPLAITAYNHGLGGMKKAVQVTGSRDIAVVIDKYEGRLFQFASKNFYSCFLAASEIAQNPDSFVGNIRYMKPIACKYLVLTEYVRPIAIASYFKINEEILSELNPALRPVVFTQERQIPAGFTLRLPSEVTITSAEKVLAQIPDSLKSKEPERPRYYRVSKGENLYTIASRLGVSAEALAAENNISRANRIYAGQVLQMPGKPVALAMAETAPAAPPAPQQSLTKATPPAPAVPSIKPVEPAPQPPSVKKMPEAEIPQPAEEQPALSWATALENPPEEEPPASPQTASRAPAPSPVILPAKMNDSLKAILLTPAETITPAALPAMKGTAQSRFDVSIYSLETTLSEVPSLAEIHVSVDETIGHYAEWLGVSASRIRQVNSFRSGSSIRIGQAIDIPVDKAGSLDRFVQARLEYHMMLEEDFYGQYKVADVKQHIVLRGENLWTICNSEEGIPLWLFKKYNKGADLSQLMPGAVVWIPMIEEKTQEDIIAELHGSDSRFPAYKEPLRAMPGKIYRLP
jgi:membrane-bound lytic murein transglycosylase D